MDAYADFIETAKALKLERFVFQDFSLQYNFDIDWEAVVASETGIGGGGSADDDDSADDERQITKHKTAGQMGRTLN